jgi:hypothetical protein
MRKIVLAGMIATMIGGAAAVAQTVVIEPDQRVKIREYVVKEKIKPITLKERIAVGAVLPADVQLTAVPATWGPNLTTYRYVYWDGRVVFVEPTSRKVAYIVD